LPNRDKITQFSPPRVNLVYHSWNYSADGWALVTSASPVRAYYGSKARGIPWIYGLSEKLKVNTFDSTSQKLSSNLVLTANVPGFSFDMDCEVAQIKATQGTNSRPWVPVEVIATWWLADISGTGCKLKNVFLGRTPGHISFTKNFDSKTGWKTNFKGVFD
jgi:hypothetical protein